METKKWYQSRLIQVGSLQAVAGAATALALYLTDGSLHTLLGSLWVSAVGWYTIYARLTTNTIIDTVEKRNV